MTNDNNIAVYTGVISNLKLRVIEHKEKRHSKSFTARYSLRKLVYYECFNSIIEAIKREKQTKGIEEKEVGIDK